MSNRAKGDPVVPVHQDPMGCPGVVVPRPFARAEPNNNNGGAVAEPVRRSGVSDRQPHAVPLSSIELTILMPCLNEARTLPACIGKAQVFLANAGMRERCWWPTTDPPTDRRPWQKPRRRARHRRASAGLRRGADCGYRRGARSLRHHGRR